MCVCERERDRVFVYVCEREKKRQILNDTPRLILPIRERGEKRKKTEKQIEREILIDK